MSTTASLVLAGFLGLVALAALLLALFVRPVLRSRRARREGVEDFFPPPRRQVLRYLLGQLLGSLAVFVPVAAVLFWFARGMPPPGPLDLETLAQMLALTAGSLTIGSLFAALYFGHSLGAASRAISLVNPEEDEELQVICQGRSNSTDRLVWVKWGEQFLVITSRRLLSVETHVREPQIHLADRDQVEAVVITDRRVSQHPVPAAFLEWLFEHRGLAFRLKDGSRVTFNTEALFFDQLLDWLRSAGFPIEDPEHLLKV